MVGTVCHQVNCTRHWQRYGHPTTSRYHLLHKLSGRWQARRAAGSSSLEATPTCQVSTTPCLAQG